MCFVNTARERFRHIFPLSPPRKKEDDERPSTESYLHLSCLAIPPIYYQNLSLFQKSEKVDVKGSTRPFEVLLFSLSLMIGHEYSLRTPYVHVTDLN